MAAKAGREHWYNNGSQQVPPLDIKPSTSEETPFKCADYGGDCKCKGRVHFGLKVRPDNGDEITTLEDLTDWMKGSYMNKQGKITDVECRRSNFKKNRKGLWKDKSNDDL